MFTRDEYFHKLGFISDPFASSNAEHEEHLNDYFIEPPYFSSLVGSLNHPKSSIVIAPRGFGKTAQRRQLEKIADDNLNTICIVYDNFPIEGISKASEVTYERHLSRITKSLLIALLSKIYVDDLVYDFDDYEKGILVKLIRCNILDNNLPEIREAISAIKGLKGRLYDIWLSASKPINSIINMILQRKGLGNVDLSFERAETRLNPEQFFENFLLIEKLFQKIQVKSVFVLIDRVDETNITGNDSSSSYLLIRPLIKDLRLLERQTIVFKFFLWDKITEHWTNDIRLDRIEKFDLSWKESQIRSMIDKRLQILSQGSIASLSQILNCSSDMIDAIILFANKSPRDLINILKQIFDVYLDRVKDIDGKPEQVDVIKGIDLFCEVKFNELIPDKKQQNDLKKLRASTFTISYLSNDVFKVKDNAIRNIIMPWTRSGIVATLPDRIKVLRNKRPVNVYYFTDIRIARRVCIQRKLEDFIFENVSKCNFCGYVSIFEKQNRYMLEDINCPNCQERIVLHQ